MEHFVKVGLSTTGDGLDIELPSGHTVIVPVALQGIHFIFQVLSEQQRIQGRATLGTKAAPTQSMVDEWLKKNKLLRFDSKGQEKKETLTLEDLGLV